MSSNHVIENTPPTASQFTAEDIASILLEHRCLEHAPEPAFAAWLSSAAALLGPHAPDRASLTDLLHLIFYYDAPAILRFPESQAVMIREGARDVIRLLAHLVLDGPDVDSDRFKEIVAILKETLNARGRELFYPIRLSLAGRAGEGELDRVILLLDSAAALPFPAPVKGTRRRILEFCSAMD